MAASVEGRWRTDKVSNGMCSQLVALLDETWSAVMCGTTPRDVQVMKPGVSMETCFVETRPSLGAKEFVEIR